jgi:hypothetical protein
MKRLCMLVGLAAVLVLPWDIAAARGCVSGAAVGGVAGHVAGHHAVIGAAAGCAINHHRNKVKDNRDNRANRDNRDNRDNQGAADARAREDQRRNGNPSVESAAQSR